MSARNASSRSMVAKPPRHTQPRVARVLKSMSFAAAR